MIHLNKWMLAASVLFSFNAHSQLKPMKTVMIEQFYVVGISIRTTNANGQSGRDIEALWGRFWGEGIQDKVPGKVSDDIYAVYTDYESDHTGAYTLIIGMKINHPDDIPEGFTGLQVEADTYRKFISKGKMPEAVFNTWLSIWQNKELNRSYRSDFTVHGKKYYDGENAEVDTYISVVK